jgi:hypothetical protein
MCSLADSSTIAVILFMAFIGADYMTDELIQPVV